MSSLAFCLTKFHFLSIVNKLNATLFGFYLVPTKTCYVVSVQHLISPYFQSKNNKTW